MLTRLSQQVFTMLKINNNTKKTRFAKHKKRNLGFTLIELLIALALGLTLSSGMVKIYIQNNISAQQDEQIARLQENARYALKLLTREIAMAGFAAGTPEQENLTPLAVDTGCADEQWSLDLSSPLDFINNATKSTALITAGNISITCNTFTELVDDTDMISIKRTADRATVENGSQTTGVSKEDNQWYLRLSDSRSQKQWRYVAGSASINTDDKTPGSDVDYWAYFHKIYFIKEIDEIPTLCAKILTGNDFEEACYVDGIENVQIEVGIDIDGDATPDIFKSSPTINEMNDVVVVRLYLLARSPNEIADYTNNKTYYLGTTTINNPNDGYFRRVYSTTIQIKNARLPNA